MILSLNVAREMLKKQGGGELITKGIKQIRDGALKLGNFIL